MHNPDHSPCPPRPPVLARAGSRRSLLRLALGLALGVAGSGTLAAMSVRQMDLKSLCDKAHCIVRGTVVEVRQGSVAAGGGTLPTVTYRVQVKEALAGAAYGVFEFTSLAPRKSNPKAGGVQALPLIELPKLKQGQEYLLFTTRPSQIGLSTLAGLGQGCFSIKTQGGKELAVNERQNVGLGLPQNGPVAYHDLAERVRELLSK